MTIAWTGCLLCVTAIVQAPFDADLLAVAERSEYRATARYDDVNDFIERLSESRVVRRADMGRTVEGRSIPLIILADPPVTTAEEAAASGKMVVFAFGNIHAGEVCGKEALLMLAREIARTPGHPLLENLVVVLAPIYNCDGNERFSKDNRPGQVGPDDGMGQRENADGLDLNRDYVKLEAPETRALVRFCNEWDPAVVIDTHTTDGSFHRYSVTYAGPRNPAGDARLIEYVRDELFPALTDRMRERFGDRMFFYGNFNRERDRWTTYPALPRYGTVYRGLCNRVAILSEAYAYESYRDRIHSTRDFVRTCFEYAVEHRAEIRELIRSARARAVEAGKRPSADDSVAIRNEITAFNTPADVAGFVEEDVDGRRRPTPCPHTYRVSHYGNAGPTLSVRRPYAYLLPPSQSAVVEKLQMHGIKVEVLRSDIDLDVEVYRIDDIRRADREFQKHRLVTVEASAERAKRSLRAGTFVVRTGQALGNLIVFLLEPESDDGFCTWNFFDDALEEGGLFPAMRLLEPAPLMLENAPAARFAADH